MPVYEVAVQLLSTVGSAPGELVRAISTLLFVVSLGDLDGKIPLAVVVVNDVGVGQPRRDVLRIVHPLPKSGVGNVQQLGVAGRLVVNDVTAVDELDEMIGADRAVAVRRRIADSVHAIVEITDNADRLRRSATDTSSIARTKSARGNSSGISEATLIAGPIDLPLRK